jgi:hypothetical protein
MLATAAARVLTSMMMGTTPSYTPSEKAMIETRSPSRSWSTKVSAAPTMLRNGAPDIEPERSSTRDTLSGARVPVGGRPRTLTAA